MKMENVNTATLTSAEWHRLVSASGLPRELWGEGWLALHNVAHGATVPQSTAVQLLAQIRLLAQGRQ